MGQVIKRTLSQTHVTWFSNRGGLGKGCDLSNLPNLQNIVCLQKVANPQMQSCLSLSDLLPRFPATAHSYLSQPFCVLWSAVILSRFPEIQVKMEKPYICGVLLLRDLLRGMVVRKFPILVLSVFSWETWQKRLIGFPSMAVNNQSQMREAGQHCFLRGGG